jgi:[acyl-carrier-protein] S-malonyltransferase
VIALAFPGQGAIEPGMGRGVPQVDHLLDVASELTGVSMRRVLDRGGAALDKTEIQQPAMVAVCLGMAGALDLPADVVLGHSLGELTAWAAAGGCTYEDAVTIAAARGASMARLATLHPGSMVAVHPRHAPAGAQVAAFNHAAQIVLTGPDLPPGTDVRATGPWHGSWMAAAIPPLRSQMQAVSRPVHTPMISNLSGEVMDTDVVARIAGQLTRPVQWQASVQRLVELGVDEVVIPGPGRVLRALIRATAPRLAVRVVGDAQSLARFSDQERQVPD